MLVPALAIGDPTRFDAAPSGVLDRARQLIPTLAASLAMSRDPRLVPAALEAGSTAEILALALGADPSPQALALLDATLVLLADHELNASTFAARVAASTGADVYACIAAALAALTGPRHGGASERVEALALEVERPERAEQVIHARLRRGQRIPGFGQPLYPHGDPRTLPLLEAALALAPDAPRVRTLAAIVEVLHTSGRPEPSVDVGIAAVSAALDLPSGLGPALFAIGRCSGWVAHVLEQRSSGQLLRPRARYREEE
jgi:citrate synthase